MPVLPSNGNITEQERKAKKRMQVERTLSIVMMFFVGK
jgi:hypothetical protein